MSNTAFGPVAKVATLSLPNKDSKVLASIWPSPNGTLLLLSELNLNPTVAQQFTSALVEVIEKSWSALNGLSLPPDKALEKLLPELNAVLQPNQRLMGNPLAPRYHLAIAIMQGADLALSTVGRVNCLLVGPDRITNILGNDGTDGRPNTKPTFEFITSGQLEINESLIMASMSLLDYFSTDKIIKLFSSQNPGAALREIEKYLNQLTHVAALGIIALRFSSAQPAGSTSPSLDKLLATESKTSQLLKPKLWSYLISRFKSTAKKSSPATLTSTNEPINQSPAKLKISKPLSQPDLTNSKSLTANQPPKDLTPTKEPLTPTNPTRASAAGKIINKIPYNFKRHCQKIVSHLAWLKSRPSAKNYLAETLGRQVKHWQKNPLSKKIASIGVLILLTAFSTSIVSLGRNNLNLKDSESYNQQVTRLTEQMANLEAALIYRDDIKARGYLTLTEQQLQQLPRDSTSRANQYQALLNHLNDLKNRLDRKAEISNLKIVSNLPNEQNWLGLNWNGSNLIIYSQQGEIIQLNNGQTKKLTQLPASLGNINKAFLQNSGLSLFIGEKKQAAFWQSQNNQTTLVNELPDMVDGSWYQGKLYFLDKATAAIFVGWPQNNKLTAARWLKTSQANLPQATSLTVDGSIYVTTNDRLNKFNRGVLNDFSVAILNPPLQNLSLVRTLPGYDYLLLLDKTNQRLTVLDKQGHLIIQLHLTDLNNLQDFTIDQKLNQIYLLNKNSIYQLDLSTYIK